MNQIIIQIFLKEVKPKEAEKPKYAKKRNEST